MVIRFHFSNLQFALKPLHCNYLSSFQQPASACSPVCSLRPGISGGRRLEVVSSVLRYVWHRDLSPVFWQSLMSADSVATGSVKASNGAQAHAKTNERRPLASTPEDAVHEFTRQDVEKMDLTDTRKFNSDSIYKDRLSGKLCQNDWFTTFSLSSVTCDASPRKPAAVEHLCFVPTTTLR